MSSKADPSITLAFLGYADSTTADRAISYEDAVLPILDDHGATLLYRGRRVDGQDDSLPLEVHLIRFPHRRALAAYLVDERRSALIRQHGEVFNRTETVEIVPITIGVT